MAFHSLPEPLALLLAEGSAVALQHSVTPRKGRIRRWKRSFIDIGSDIDRGDKD